MREKIEQAIIRQSLSSRGGGIEIDLTHKNNKNLQELRKRLIDKIATPNGNTKIFEGIDLNLQIAKKISNLFNGTIKIGIVIYYS